MESDGSLLDGASLANEWSLPVLPEDNSSHPSSSQEMADIFGTSDDEEVVDFPFGLSSDLPVPKGFEDITLPGGNGNSLLSNADSELFLAGFRPSDSREATKASPQKEEVQKEREIEPQDEKMEAVEKQNDNKKDIEPVSDHTESTKEPAAATEESTETLPSKEAEALVRKSARLRARVGDTESCSEPEHVEPSKQPPRPETPPPPPVKEEPPILEPKGEEGKMEDVVVEKKKDSSPTVSSSEDSGSDDDSEGEDPNKLYCICRQPHDDRFMICCDVCEDWFHGNCVGITVGQGKKMEREGREYVCPVCLQRQHMTKEEAAASRSARQLQREVARDKVIKKKLAAQGLTEPHAKRRRTLSGSTPTDGYGMSQLFLPDNAPRGGDVSSTLEQEDVKPNANDLLYYDCVISSCPNKSLPPSIYCSSECIEKHVSSSLRRLASRGIKVSTNASEFVKGSGGVGVVEKATNKILMGMCAPSERELVPWLQSHPSYQVLIPDKGKKSKLKSTRVKVKAEAKTEEIKYPTLMDPDSVRANAKKALYQILWKRHGDAADMSSVTQSAVEAIAHDIEEKLFNLNQDINPKYKNKYRSLIFNLKDSKNQGLFRKVLTKEIGSRELVRMSSEKLASKELAAWRESTLKKDLEMIKQREEEAGALGEVIRKVTHKGEIEIDSSEIGDKIIMESSSITDSPKPAHVESTKLDSKPHSKSKKQSSDAKSPDNKGTSGGGILALLQSTTSEHGQHLYDHHCDICTGKMKPPTLSTSPPPSPDSRMHEDAHTTEHTSPDSVVKPLSPVPQYDPHKVLWRGPVSMVGLSQFSSTAYPVSGHTDYIAEHLPKAMHVMGRIAYAQVWDYLDKIRSSGSKEICVIHFGWPEEEQDAYVSMFNYLLRKHRSGVIISSGPDAIKDMYLVPLPGHWDVPEQLLPITGPGLPVGRSDMMLGVIVHSKSRRMSLHSNHSSPVTRIKAEVTFKRHRSSSNDTEGLQRKKNKVEIGFGDRTPPPISSKHRAETKREPIKNEDDDSTPYSPSKMYEDSSFDDALSSKPAVEVKKEKPKTVQMSFYGEHQPASSKSTVTVPSPVKAIPVVNSPKSVATSSEDTTNKLIDINTTAVAASLKSALNLPPTANIQTLLANLSSSKLKELASAVSTLEKISDGPIDQSTLAAAGTGKLRAVFSSDGPSNSSPPVPSVPASGPSEPPPHRQSLQQVTPLDQPTHPYQPQESQFRTEWDQRHQRPTFRPEPPPPPQQQQQQQYHPQDTPYQQPTPNQPPPPNHGPMNDLPPPPSNDPSYPPPPSNDPSYPPPPNNDPSYPPPQHNDPSSYHPPQAEQHSWRDPRTNWGQQQQYQHEHQQPQDDGWNRDERFNNNSGRGYRGGYRGRGERRGTWDKDHRSEHGDRYRGYHT